MSKAVICTLQTKFLVIPFVLIVTVHAIYRDSSPTIGFTTKYVHIKSTTVYAPRRNWDSPNPFLASECSPPPRNRGEGAH